MDQRCSETPQFETTGWDIIHPSFRRTPLLPAIYPTIPQFILHHIPHLEYCTTIFLHRACPKRDFRQSQGLRHHWVVYMPRNNVLMTIQNHQIIVHELPLANAVNLANTSINIIRRKGMVALTHSSHFPVLARLITVLHSTWHQVRYLPPVQATDFQVMGLSGKHMTSTKVVIVGL